MQIKPRRFEAGKCSLVDRRRLRRWSHERRAIAVWRGEGDFPGLLKSDKDVAKALNAAELEGCSTLATT
jgi:hypothetical protein